MTNKFGSSHVKEQNKEISETPEIKTRSYIANAEDKFSFEENNSTPTYQTVEDPTLLNFDQDSSQSIFQDYISQKSQFTQRRLTGTPYPLIFGGTDTDCDRSYQLTGLDTDTNSNILITAYQFKATDGSSCGNMDANDQSAEVRTGVVSLLDSAGVTKFLKVGLSPSQGFIQAQPSNPLILDENTFVFTSLADNCPLIARWNYDTDDGWKGLQYQVNGFAIDTIYQQVTLTRYNSKFFMIMAVVLYTQHSHQLK